MMTIGTLQTKIGKVFTKNPAFPDQRGMNLQSREKLCHNVITKLIWTRSWVKVRSLPRTHLRRNPEVTIATFVTVLSKIPSIFSITSTEKNVSIFPKLILFTFLKVEFGVGVLMQGMQYYLLFSFTIATFVTVQSKIPSISSITSKEKNIRLFLTT